MRAGELALWLQEHDPDDSVAVTVAFPQVDGWEVTSWDVLATEEEGMPAVRVSVYASSFDYASAERALAREARAFLKRYEEGLNNG